MNIKHIKKFIFFSFFLLLACSSDDSKKDSSKVVVSRPTRPITDNEVQIGTQIWMTKNLNVTRYRNGDPIPQVNDPSEWANLTTGAWCFNLTNTDNGVKYGKLYNWYAVNDPRGLAPIGYHVPSDAEWTTLTTFLGGFVVAGGKMKATTGWNPPNTNATNSSGFTGLPAGYRAHEATFFTSGEVGKWWSSSQYDATSAWQRTLFHNQGVAAPYASFKGCGFSVRCLKN